MFYIGEKAVLIENPLDEQLGQFIPLGVKEIIDVKDTQHLSGTSGQWVKISEYSGWIDSSYFEKAVDKTK